MSSVQILTDDERAELNSIASKLSELSEEYLTEEIDEETYAFAVHDLLAECLPTPCSPAHIVVLKRLKDWKEAVLITDEQKRSCFQRVIAASKKGDQSSSSSSLSSNVSETNDLDELLVDEDGDPFVERSSALSPKESPVRSLSFDDERGEMEISSSPAAQRPEQLPATPCNEAAAEKEPNSWAARTEVSCNKLNSSQVKEVYFMRMGNASDFINNGRAYIECMMLKPGCVRKYLKHNRWVEVDTLTRSSSSAEATTASLSPRKSPRLDLTSQGSQSRQAQRPGVDTDGDGIPELAAHERGRKLPHKREATGKGTAWSAGGVHKTPATKVPLQKRVDDFPDQSLTIASTPNGKVLFCRCCPKEIENILGTIKTHVTADRHKEKMVKWMERNKSDVEVKDFLEQYFQDHPNEKTVTLSPEVQLYRWRVVESCLYAGIPMEKIDDLRELLERGGTTLTDSHHLKAFVPKIEEFEFKRLLKELEGQRVCVIFDGTTRLGECIAVLIRWCPPGFEEIQQRLVALRTTKAHMNGDELGALINTIIGTTCGVQTINVVCGARDSCSTNGKAMRNLAPMYINMESILCISHTLSHCGEHVALSILDAFMTSWLGLVQNHPSARSIWKELLGGSMKGYSPIRWCSREEVSNELAKNFGLLPGFVDTLLNDEIGDKLPKKMKEILDNQSEKLELELACNLDLEPIISTCYTLEGDGLVILLARAKIDSLLAFGDTVGDRADTLPNVAALLRKQIELKVGVKISEYFADVQPPRYFEGVITSAARGKFKVKYEDNSSIEQEEREVRQWLEVREMDEWKRLAAAAKGGITYLRNRLTGNLPPQQRNFDCSHMYEVLRVVQAFDPSWAALHLDANVVNALAAVTPLRNMTQALLSELPAYQTAVAGVVIDHSEGKQDHTFTKQVLNWWAVNGSTFPAWAEAAQIVFSFTPNSAAAERVFSMLKLMFGDLQMETLADIIQTALMLRINKRTVG